MPVDAKRAVPGGGADEFWVDGPGAIGRGAALTRPGAELAGAGPPSPSDSSSSFAF